jgi:anti-sigma B factor antagonist
MEHRVRSRRHLLHCTPPVGPAVAPEEFVRHITGLIDGLAVVHLVGELDLAGFDALDAYLHQVRRAHGDRLVLELSRLTFIDASGLRLLLRHHTQTRRAGGCLDLAAPHPRVAQVLRVAGLTGHLLIHDTLPAAIDHARRPPA